MKSRIRRGFVLVGGLLALGLATAAGPASARVDVDIDLFVDALSPHGDWFDYPGYGAAWRPTHVHRGWRPYTDGRWVWSDGHGWVWAENEDWGWATYHYGRWLYDGRMGWVWIPGNEWAPAWVDWRRGPNYIGWLPLPPAGISIASIGPARWIFVSQRHFFSPRLYDVAFIPSRRIFHECRDEIRMRHNNGGWYNRGADRHGIERIARASAPVVRVRDVDHAERAHFANDGHRDGGELQVFRPNVRETRVSRTFPTAPDRAAIGRAPELQPPIEKHRDPLRSRVGTASDRRLERDSERRWEREADRRAQPPVQPQRSRASDWRELHREIATPTPTRSERVYDRSHGRDRQPERVAVEQPRQVVAPAPQVQTRQNRQERGGTQRVQKHGAGEPEQQMQVPAAPIRLGAPNRR